VSLRSTTIEHELTLPDGRKALVRVGMAHDEYIPAREELTVVLELRVGDHVLATLNTVLDPEQEAEAAELAREVVDALGSGRITPTATALEQYADRLR
jgi:porphobilinogen deaminase